MSYYAGDSWTFHQLNEVKCAECEDYFDDQEGEGNICPACIEKEGEAMKEYAMVFNATIKASDIERAIEKARANYGNEVADYGSFTIVEGESE